LRQTVTSETPNGIRTSECRLLVIDDENNMRHMLTALLSKWGYQVDTAHDGEAGLKLVQARSYDFILCDVKMPRMDGMAFLKAAHEHLVGITVIMMSAYGSFDVAIEAMKLGAYDYISKPFKTDEILLVLKKAEEREKLKNENILLKKKLHCMGNKPPFGSMVGRSQPMRNVFQLARKVAKYSTTVLITGERSWSPEGSISAVTGPKPL